LSFLNPLFLFGLLAASIPVIIHLFTRRRPREVRFPSLEFLSEVNQSEIRRLRLKQWLLLLLRTLAILAIALAMARPALRGSAGLASGAATTIVALVDRSGSMGAEAGIGGAGAAPDANGAAGAPGGTLIRQTRRVIEDLLLTLGPEDALLLVPYDDAPHPLTADPISDVSRLRGAAQSLEAGARSTDHAPALELAARVLATSRALNRELFWISDFQATGFRHDEQADAVAGDPPGALNVPGPWEQTCVYLVPMMARSIANVALTDATLAPVEGGIALAVTAMAFGATPGDLAVEASAVETNQEIGRGFLDVPERGETATLLPLASLPPEGGVASIPGDALALDNRRYFPAGRAGTQRIVLREDDAASAVRFALEAGSPASGLAVDAVGAGDLPARLADADAVVINDVERLGASEVQAVLDYHRAGGALFIVLGDRADTEFWNTRLLADLGVGRMGVMEQTAPGATWRLIRSVAGHALLAGFPARPGEPLSNARFERVRAFTPGPRARVLLEFDAAHPALVEGPHVLVFCGSLDPGDSDFPVSGAYLPLLHQAVKVLARGTAAASLRPGERYSAPATTGTWRIEDEAGHEIASELVATGGATRLSSEPLESPGLYRVLRGGELRSTFAVNPDRAESNLAPLADDALIRAFPPGRASILRPGADLARRVREARFGRELWSWFVVIALLLLVAEMVLARWGMPGRRTVEAGG
jgi:Aerotolerance regulator N-terminal/von Willebrand factor type A domain